jgi:hypothetical protein
MTPGEVREVLKEPFYGKVFCGKEVHEGDLSLHNGASVKIVPRHFAGLPQPRIIPISSVTKIVLIEV